MRMCDQIEEGEEINNLLHSVLSKNRLLCLHMATIIDDDKPIVDRRESVRVERTESDASGWVVAVIILVLVIAGGVWFWMHRARTAAPAPSSGSTNINVTLPGGTSNSGSDSGSDAGAAQ
jgi:hypothetical protein